MLSNPVPRTEAELVPYLKTLTPYQLRTLLKKNGIAMQQIAEYMEVDPSIISTAIQTHPGGRLEGIYPLISDFLLKAQQSEDVA